MNKDEQLIEALKLVISAKDELITNLKSEVERLRSSQTVQITPVGTLPYIQPYSPLLPVQPGYPPIYPWYSVTTGDPLPNPPYTTISTFSSMGSGSNTTTQVLNGVNTKDYPYLISNTHASIATTALMD